MPCGSAKRLHDLALQFLKGGQHLGKPLLLKLPPEIQVTHKLVQIAADTADLAEQLPTVRPALRDASSTSLRSSSVSRTKIALPRFRVSLPLRGFVGMAAAGAARSGFGVGAVIG